MALILNGLANTIGGLAAGGLPDDSVTTADVNFSPGKILQVVTATNTTAKTIAGTSFVDTDLTCDITPSATSSKVLVHVSHFIEQDRFSGGDTLGCAIQLLRDSTVIKYAKGGGKYISVPEESNYIVWNGIETFFILDSPSSTSALTYKTQAKENHADQSTTLNGGSATEGISMIVLMEVSG